MIFPPAIFSASGAFNGKAFWAEDGWHFFDETKTSAEIIVQFYRTIYESAAPGTVILGCNVIGHLAAGLVHLNRTGDDTRFVSCQPDQANGQIEADLREAFRLSADQQDTLIPLDWMENPWPERWMVNGKEMLFCWDEKLA